MLATFQRVVEHGHIRWIGVTPPEGARVMIVAQELPFVARRQKHQGMH
jgi:hypothetical protein